MRCGLRLGKGAQDTENILARLHFAKDVLVVQGRLEEARTLLEEVVAQTKNGKQVLNVKGDTEAHVCSTVPENGDYVAAIGENHKLILFPLTEGKEAVVGGGVADCAPVVAPEGDDVARSSHPLAMNAMLATSQATSRRAERAGWMNGRKRGTRVA